MRRAACFKPAWLALGAWALAADAATLTALRLGDLQSEQQAALAANQAPVQAVSGLALGEPARRLLPATGQPASLVFDLRLDPRGQNYITLRLWGGDTTWTPVQLVRDEDGVALGNLWWHVTREAPAPGRFFYRTMALPIEVTQGRTQMRVRIQSTPAPEKPGTFRNADAPAPKLEYRPSFAIHAVYSHTDAWYEPGADERQGPAFAWGAPKPVAAAYAAAASAAPAPAASDAAAAPAADPVEARLIQRARADIARVMGYDLARSRYDTGHRYDTRVLASLPELYRTPWSGHYQSDAVAEKARAAIDVHVLRQARLGDPGAMFYRGWMSHGNIGHAYSGLHKVFESKGWLDQPLTLTGPDGGTRTVSRRAAYTEFFHDAYEWRRQDRRFFTNQPVYVSLALYRMQKALRALGDKRALTEAQAVHYMHIAIGLEPLRTRSFAMDAAEAGYPYFTTTKAGLSREKGYVDAYGELSDVLIEMADESQDPKIMAFTRQFLRARAVFRVPANDDKGHRALRGIGAISWRTPTLPFRLTYAGVAEAGVLGTDEPAVVRLAQLEIEHGRLNDLSAAPEMGPHWDPALSIRLVERYRKVRAMAPTPYRLPGEPGQPNFVWADPENGVFVFREGRNLVYGSFYNADAFHGRAVGDRGLAHVIRDERESIIEFTAPFAMKATGGSFTATYPWGTRTRPQAALPPGMSKWATEPPEAVDFRAGRADLYWQRLGPYLVVMNTTEPGTYREAVMTVPAQQGLKTGRDLRTGAAVDLRQPLRVAPGETRILVLP